LKIDNQMVAQCNVADSFSSIAGVFLTGIAGVFLSVQSCWVVIVVMVTSSQSVVCDHGMGKK